MWEGLYVVFQCIFVLIWVRYVGLLRFYFLRPYRLTLQRLLWGRLFFKWSRDYFFLVYPLRGYEAVSIGRQRHWVPPVGQAHISLSYNVDWVYGFRVFFD